MSGYEFLRDMVFGVVEFTAGVCAGFALLELLRHFVGALYEFGRRLYINQKINRLYAQQDMVIAKKDLRFK